MRHGIFLTIPVFLKKNHRYLPICAPFLWNCYILTGQTRSHLLSPQVSPAAPQWSVWAPAPEEEELHLSSIPTGCDLSPVHGLAASIITNRRTLLAIYLPQNEGFLHTKAIPVPDRAIDLSVKTALWLKDYRSKSHTDEGILFRQHCTEFSGL